MDNCTACELPKEGLKRIKLGHRMCPECVEKRFMPIVHALGGEIVHIGRWKD